MTKNAVRQSTNISQTLEIYSKPHVKAPKKRNLQQRKHVSLQSVNFAVCFLVSLTMFFFASVKMLEVTAEIQQTNKEIRDATRHLEDILAYNAVLSNQMPVYDRDYIYTYAVGKLGMRYPDKNQVIYYEAGEYGYVRQVKPINNTQ